MSISRIARGLGIGYVLTGIAVAGFALMWAPWGLLLLVISAVLWGVAFVVFVVAAGIARTEYEDAEGLS